MDLETRVEELRELLNTKQYTGLRQELMELNEADIAMIMEEMEDKEMLKIFRILPKDLAADVFAYMEVENQQFIITSLSERDAANIIDNLMADDATDLLEEMPASVVKKLLSLASPETRRDINLLLRYPEESAGSIMTVDYVDLKENLTSNCLFGINEPFEEQFDGQIPLKYIHKVSDFEINQLKLYRLKSLYKYLQDHGDSDEYYEMLETYHKESPWL